MTAVYGTVILAPLATFSWQLLLIVIMMRVYVFEILEYVEIGCISIYRKYIFTIYRAMVVLIT